MTNALPMIVLVSALSAGTAYSDDLKVWVMKIPQVVEQTVQPVYSAQAWSEKLVRNGSADVRVDGYGFPTSVKLVSWETMGRNADASGLDQATIAAIKQWRFSALHVSGKFVRYDVRIGFLVRPDGITYMASKPEPTTSLE